MLPKKNRITRKDFPVCNKQGVRVFLPLFSGTIYKNEGDTKVSVVVSKKTATTAVVRNYLRRIFYEATNEYIKSFPKGTQIVFYPKGDAQKAAFLVLKNEIKKMLRKAEITM